METDWISFPLFSLSLSLCIMILPELGNGESKTVTDWRKIEDRRRNLSSPPVKETENLSYRKEKEERQRKKRGRKEKIGERRKIGRNVDWMDKSHDRMEKSKVRREEKKESRKKEERKKERKRKKKNATSDCFSPSLPRFHLFLSNELRIFSPSLLSLSLSLFWVSIIVGWTRPITSQLFHQNVLSLPLSFFLSSPHSFSFSPSHSFFLSF